MTYSTSNNRYTASNVSSVRLSDMTRDASYQYTQNIAHTEVNSITIYLTYSSSNKSATLTCQIASTQSGFTTGTTSFTINTSQSNTSTNSTINLSTPIQIGSSYTISCPSYSGDNNGKVKINSFGFLINP